MLESVWIQSILVLVATIWILCGLSDGAFGGYYNSKLERNLHSTGMGLTIIAAVGVLAWIWS